MPHWTKRKTLRQLLSMLSSKLFVGVRLVPAGNSLANLNVALSVKADKCIVCTSAAEVEQQFHCDRAWGGGEGQDEVFRSSLQKALPLFLQGSNVAAFCYGPPNSGKTYTAFGANPLDSALRGLLPRAITHVLTQIQAETPRHPAAGEAPRLSLTLLDVTADTVVDLLARRMSEGDSGLTQSDAYTGRLAEQRLTFANIASERDAATAFSIAGLYDTTSPATEKDGCTARVAIISLMSPLKSASSGVRHLYIVDLPSSRNLDENGRLRSGTGASTTSSRLQVTMQTLMNLCNCINAAAHARTRHVPWRDSRLTRVLSDVFDGQHVIFLLAHTRYNAGLADEDCINVLRYVVRAKPHKVPFLGGVSDGPGCQFWTQDRPLASISSGMSSELAAAWRYTYWLECLLVSILDESGSSNSNSQIAHKRQHVEALAAILRDYTAITGGRNAFRPADAVLRPVMLANDSSSITLPASSIQLRNFRAGHDCRGAAHLLLNSGVYSRMTSDFARDFFDVIPPTLGPNPSISRSSGASDTAVASANFDHQPNSQSWEHASSLAPATKPPFKVSTNLATASLSSPSKKASAARQRYVGLAASRSPHSSRNRFDLGLDSPGTPPPPQPTSRVFPSPVVVNASSKPVWKPSSSEGVEASSRVRLLDLDSRILQLEIDFEGALANEYQDIIQRARALQADVADAALAGFADDDAVAELLSRISGISLRAEEEAGSGILSVKDLVANIPPFSVRTSRNTRVFSVGLHSPPSPKSEMHISPASSDRAGARGRNAAVAASMAMLVEQVPIRVVNLFGRKIPGCFASADAVRFFDFLCPSSARAVLYNFCGLPPPHNDSPLLLQCLVDSSVIVQLTLEDSTVLRLAADEDVPLVLNAQHDEWIEDPPPSDIVQVSANLLDTAVACAMRRDGFSVSSNGKLGQPADVAALMKEAQVLHRITLHGRSSAELQAFFANVFNTLALHAWCIDRWPVSQELLYPGCPCWRALRYTIAGFDYSLEDILTGILRGRKCSQLHPDPRILCVLAMAPSSLPPPTLTAVRLDLDLDRAVRRFCLRHVSVSGCVVTLPNFFQWFVDDFAAPGSSGDAAMLLWVSRFCDARVAGQLRRIVLQGGFKIEIEDSK